MLDHTSKEYDWQRRKDEVVQQDERVLVQVGGVEAGCMILVLATADPANAYLLNGRYQNIANTQITFYPGHQHT